MNASPKFLSVLLLEGILFSLFGFLLILTPFHSSLIIELIAGFTILIGGIVQTIESFNLYRENVTAWPFLMAGVMAIIIGVLLIFYPFSSLKIITILVTIYFAAKAILEFMAAIVLRINGFSWWLIANGLILSLLVIYILNNWSIISLMLLGLLVGFNFLSSGIIRIMLSIRGKVFLEKII